MKRTFAFLVTSALMLTSALTGLGGVGISDAKADDIQREEVGKVRQAFSYGNSPKNKQDAWDKGYRAEPEQIKQTTGENVWFYVRETEIVPIGDEPKAKGVYRYIRDDGTFRDPSKQPTMRAPYRSFGGASQLPVPAYTYTDQNLKNQYLPRNGYANIAVFYGHGAKDKNFFYCVNPNSYDPENSQIYIEEPTRFSGQTNFRDVPEISYVLNVIMKHVELTRPNGELPDWPRAYGAMRLSYNEVNLNRWNKDTEKYSRLDPRLTNQEVRDQLLKIMTRFGQPTVVDGETIPVQKDWNTPESWQEIGDTGDYDDTVALGIEYTFNHYAQGFPIGGLDRYQAVAGYWGYAMADRTRTSAAFARILFAHVEAARARGFLDNVDGPTPIQTQVTGTNEHDGVIDVHVKLGNLDDANTVEAVVPSYATITSPAITQTSPQTGHPVIPRGVNEVTIQIPADKKSDDFEVSFVKTADKQLMGSAWVLRSSYRFDEESGHWIAKEYSAFNPYPQYESFARWGFSQGQQVVAFDKQEAVVSTPLVIHPFRSQPKVATTLAVNGVNGTSDAIRKLSFQETFNPLVMRDIVAYEGLEKDKTYEAEFQFLDFSAPDTEQELFTFTKDLVADSSAGEWSVEIPADKLANITFKAGHTYGIRLNMWEKDNVSNVAALDHTSNSEKFTIETPVYRDGTLGTSAKVNDQIGSDTKLVRIGTGDLEAVPVQDVVEYYGLFPGVTYTLKATLKEVDEQGVATDALNDRDEAIVGSLEFTPDNTGRGKVTVNLGTHKLQPGKTYVVYERAESKEDIQFQDGFRKHIATHEDPKSRAQMIVTEKPVPDGKDALIRTNVSTTYDVDGTPRHFSADPTAPLIVPAGTHAIVDNVYYSGLIPGNKYIFYGYMYKMTNGKIDFINPAFSLTKAVDVTSPEGTLTMDFSAVKVDNFETYIVYEEAVSVKKIVRGDNGEMVAHRVVHHDILDKAQTVEGFTPAVVRTTVTANQVKASADAPAKITSKTDTVTVPVTDTVTYEGLKAKEEYTFQATLMDVTDLANIVEVKKADPVKVTIEASSGTQEVPFGNVELKAGRKYVVYETVTSTNKFVDPDGDHVLNQHVVTHHDFTDKAQTVVIVREASLKTTVKAGESTASDNAAATVTVAAGAGMSVEVNVVDTVAYTNLFPGNTYTFTGQLMDVTDKNNITKVAEASATKEITEANGEVQIDFKSVALKPGKTYVVYETATSEKTIVDMNDDGVLDKHVVEHKNPDDLAQTVVVEKPNNPDGKNATLKTTVTANSVVANANTPAKITAAAGEATVSVPVTDHVAYTGLFAGKTYTFEGVLMDVTDPDNPQTVATATPVEKVVDTADGTVDIDFGSVTLKTGVKYVVFETATSKDDLVDTNNDNILEKHVVKHADPTDKAQTVVVARPDLPNGKDAELKTTVKADGTAASDAAPVTVTVAAGAGMSVPVTVVDTIHYKGLIANEEYTFTGQLMDVTNPDAPVAVGDPVTLKKTIDAAEGDVEMDFGSRDLTPGVTYVVYETAVSTNDIVDTDGDGVAEKHVVKHENPNDKAQTVVLTKPTNPDGKNGSLKTTVKANGNAASDKAPVTVNAATGVGTKVTVAVVDTVDYKGLVAGKEYTFTGALMDVTDPAKPVEVKTVTHDETVATTDGTVEIPFGDVELTVGHTYVVYETAVSKEKVIDTNGDNVLEKQTVEHKNPNDKAQTVVVASPNYPDGKDASLKTTVKANGNAASDKAPVTVTAAAGAGAKATITVVDTVTYKGLVPGKAYTFTGKLMDVTDPAKPVEVKTVTHEETVTTADGTVEIPFGDVELTVDHTYVVFETATSKEPVIDSNGDGTPEVQTVKHEDPKDKAQTVVVTKPTNPDGKDAKLSTTVGSGNHKASKDAPLAIGAKVGDTKVKIDVVDTVTYTGLVPGKAYAFTGQLMDVTDPAKPVEVATVTHEQIVTTADGTIEIPFGEVELTVGHTYVVFETAISKEPVIDTNGDNVLETQKVEHMDPNDKAQTVVVRTPEPEYPKGGGELKTTVTAGSASATVDVPATVKGTTTVDVPVTDHVTYKGLVPGAQYTLEGRLMDVTDPDAPVEVAKASTTFTPVAADGTIKMDFGTVKLTVGHTYVVFEKATSTEPVIDPDGDHTPEVHVVTHEDPKDVAQTVVVVRDLPKTGVTVPLGAIVICLLAGTGLVVLRRKMA